MRVLGLPIDAIDFAALLRSIETAAGQKYRPF